MIPAVRIALRFFFTKKKRGVIHLTTIVATGGVLAVTMALILVLSVFNGFEKFIYSGFSPFSPDLKIESVKESHSGLDNLIDSIQTLKSVKRVCPIIESKVFLKKGKFSTIALLKAVPLDFFDSEEASLEIYEGFNALQHDEHPLAIVGYDLKDRLSIDIQFDKLVDVYTPKPKFLSLINPLSNFHKQKIEIGGITYYYYDSADVIFVSLDWAKQNLGKREPTAIDVFLKDRTESEAVKTKIRKWLSPGDSLRSLEEINIDVFKVIKIERFSIYFILSFILLIASFNTFASVSMILIDKKQHIHTLTSVGVNFSNLKNIFMTQGLLIAVFGCVFGIGMAYGLGVLQQKFGFVKMGIDNTPYPVVFRTADFLWVSLIVILTGWLTSWLAVRISLDKTKLLEGHE